MFCYQRSFGSPTEIITAEQFRALITAPRTIQGVREAREALARGDKKTYDAKKKGLPFVIFIATYDESEKEFENKQTGEKTKKWGTWRNQKFCHLNGLCVIDFDHIEGDVRKVWQEAYEKLSDEDKRRILFVFVTPSGQGLKVVFIADVSVGNLIDNQKAFSLKLGLNPDEACKDASRGAFLTTSKDIILIDEERLITYENEEFGKKYDAEYHAGHSAPTKTAAVAHQEAGHGSEADGQVDNQEVVTYNGVPVLKIIDAWMEGRNLTNQRHDTLVELSDHLRYLIGKNPTKITKVVMQLTWVQDLAADGEDVAGTVSSIMGWRYRQKKPDEVMEALKKSGALTQGTVPLCSASSAQQGQSPSESTQQGQISSESSEDIFGVLPLDKWAEELQEMAQYYPCLKELFLNVHPHKLPAVLFSSAALFGTLMTRAWYHFWYEPEIVRRLNYCIFIIGDPGAGKHIIEKFYKKIADPMIQADKCLVGEPLQGGPYRENHLDEGPEGRGAEKTCGGHPSTPRPHGYRRVYPPHERCHRDDPGCAAEPAHVLVRR